MSFLSRFARASAVTARTTLALLAAVVALLVSLTAAPFGATTASADTHTNAAKYYGMGMVHRFPGGEPSPILKV